MNSSFTRGMAKATALTRSGNLQDATALIQTLLQSGKINEPVADTTAQTIDGTFTELTPETPATHPAATDRQSAASRSRATHNPRSTLAETLRKIAAGGMPARGPLVAEAALPAGAQFLSLTHTGAQGSRTYRLYVPANRACKPMPLIVMLHGCTQSPEDFATGTGMNALAEEYGCLIAYPAQPAGANAQKCWNWYRPEDQRRDRGEAGLLAGLTLAVQRDHAADATRTYIAGLSAGGAAAAVMAAAYPEIFSAVGVHSGLAAGAARDVPSAFAAMRSGSDAKPHQIMVPTIAFHGLADSTVHPDNGAAVMSQALHAMPGLQRKVTSGAIPGGRAYRTTVHLNADGKSLAEHWQIEGAGHAWAGGQAAASYTDPKGPNASRQMLRFFLQHQRP